LWGSGTVVFSAPDGAGSLILTCAHLCRFSRDHVRVDCAAESAEAEAVDYDPGRDVGLLWVTPRYPLRAARIVPVSWRPERDQRLIGAGCSRGAGPTLSDDRLKCIHRPFRGMPGYDALECVGTPEYGRSGGGLFTLDGFLVGVAGLVNLTGHGGLYATWESVHFLLTRNGLEVNDAGHACLATP
jgi:hypothetical protein